MTRLRQLRCSFCRKKESEVSKLVAGPRVYICDRCVAIATELMNDPPTLNPPSKGRSSLWNRVVSRIRNVNRGAKALRVGLPAGSS